MAGDTDENIRVNANASHEKILRCEHSEVQVELMKSRNNWSFAPPLVPLAARVSLPNARDLKALKVIVDCMQ